MYIRTTAQRERGTLRRFNSTANAGISGLTGELATWNNLIASVGGTLTGSSLSIAGGIIDALSTTSYKSKLKYLLPLLGANMAAARVPLIDRLSAGISANTGFVDADFSETVGLASTGSKYLNTFVSPSMLDSVSGGVGWWSNYVGSGNDETCGVYNGSPDYRYGLSIRGSLSLVIWGNPSVGGAVDFSTPSAGNFYGQKFSATDIRLFKNGTSVATSSSNHAGEAASGLPFYVMQWNGDIIGTTSMTCKAFYLTDGTLTTTEISDLHTLLDTYLITPTGR